MHGLFVSDGKDEAFSKLLEEIFNQVLVAQSDEQIGAAPYERTDERNAYRNGYRDRQLTTCMGTLTLHVPRHRDGDFNTELFERYQRSEQALLLAMMQLVVSEVSSRKVEDITYELCGRKFSKSLVSKLCERLNPIVKAFQNRPLEKHYPFLVVDALYLKIHEDSRVHSKGLLVAVAVNQDGNREVVGFRVAETESETSWSEFFSSLRDHGLKDVHLVTSDSATKVRNEIMDNYETRAPRAMKLLDEAFAGITAVLSVPFKYRKRLRTNNGIERLNQEIRRRERVVRIFPNEASVIRLIGALLMEQDEKWQTGRKYTSRWIFITRH